MDSSNNQIKVIEDLDIKNNSFIVIASKRNSGKTVLNKNLIKHLLDSYEYHWMVIFSDTCQFNGDYDGIFENEFMYKSDDLDTKIEKILSIQEKSIKKNNKNIPHGLIVLDDVKVYNRSKMLCDLAIKSRHFKISCICAVQYCKELISSSIRSNIDYIFFSDMNENAIQSIYHSIHVPYNFKMFKKFVDDNNTNYQFIFYNSKEPDKSKRLSIVKARLFNNLKLQK